ncbi:hypothetical protein N4P33_15600 [Streptomyces sp. 15-116A]|uniref:hypothetical protein n=1 Tax=Streptomyces sp. 15-116A TaxID=2259035 RepID=UPI0021B2D05A|nr:hypothetical protein [Streptomyces sp. 15-116A]MCT7353587.1 hypothetical protein [Streptomyces sp. 15-116A]
MSPPVRATATRNCPQRARSPYGPAGRAPDRIDLLVPDIAAARDFYTGYLGLSVEGFDLGWVAQYRSPDGRAEIQLLTRDATAPLTRRVGQGGPGRRRGVRRGATTRIRDRAPAHRGTGGLRRFFVRAPDGNILSIVSHEDT